MKLTPVGFQKLKDEIKKTEAELKETLAAKGEAAETGGNVWHDNFAFEQLVQRENELRQNLARLKDKLDKSETVGTRNTAGKVDIGSRVTIRLQNGTEKTLTIGDPETADPTKNIISYESPLGKILMDGKVGEEKEYTAAGRTNKVKILKIL